MRSGGTPGIAVVRRKRVYRAIACASACVAYILAAGPRGLAQEATTSVSLDGPPPPLAPAVFSRGEDGRATIRAVRVAEPLRIDGVLDEGIYEAVRPLSDFIQVEPVYLASPTERTDAWVLFDDDYLYISCRCWDSAPESRWVANEMRRDSINVLQNENFAVLIDTFYDRRSGVILNANVLGGRMDGQMTDERPATYNGDWNPVWELRTGRFENGWTVEAAIPFKSLRYRPGRSQVWGLNLRRYVKWKNEVAFLSPVSEGRGFSGIFQASRAATLVGLEAPESRNGGLEVKPYAIAELESVRTGAAGLTNDPGADVGVDVKYSVTQNLVADLTVNTDFAQVEADEQQVNLTRFSLFFPEKREFFLENQGLFAFGGGGTGGGGNAPVLFYSRQIGLSRGVEVPIEVGGRLTGKLGRFSLGAISIRTGDGHGGQTPATAFSVMRIRGDVLRRSSIGAIFTGRSVSQSGQGSAETYGIDGIFSFYENLNLNTYWALTSTPGPDRNNQSYRAQLDYSADRYGLQAERLVVGRHFDPEVGFLRRSDFERSFAMVRFSPRPQSIAAIRKLSWQAQVDYITDRTGVLETREAEGQFGIEFENSDQLNLSYTRSYEFLDRPFRIASGVTIPTGGYTFQDIRTSFTLGQQRTLSGTISAQHGSFFGGDKTGIGFSGGRLEVTPQLSTAPSVSINWVDVPAGRFTTKLITARTTYTVTPQMFVSALVQYNSSCDTLGTNLRLRWEYQSGSELFIVYNEQRDTLTQRFPGLENRAFVVKINRLFRF